MSLKISVLCQRTINSYDIDDSEQHEKRLTQKVKLKLQQPCPEVIVLLDQLVVQLLHLMCQRLKGRLQCFLLCLKASHVGQQFRVE